MYNTCMLYYNQDEHRIGWVDNGYENANRGH